MTGPDRTPPPGDPVPTVPGEELAVEGLLIEMGRCSGASDDALVARVMDRVAEEAASTAAEPGEGEPGRSPSGRIRSAVVRLNRSAGQNARRQRRARTGGWRIAVAAAAAAVLVTAGSWWLSRAGSWSAELATPVGRTAVSRGGQSMPGSAGMQILPGDAIETGGDGRAELHYLGEETRMAVGTGSRLRLADETGAKHLFLDRGIIRARVDRQPPGRPMVLVTPHARVEVVGTGFTLEAGPERTRLEVQDGRVRLAKTDASAAVLVDEGCFALALPGMRLVSGPIAPPEPAPVGKPAPSEKVVLNEPFDDVAAWAVTGWRQKGSILFDLSREVFRSAPGALRIRYTYPRLPGVGKHMDRWVVNHRSVDRRVSVPEGATHVRLRIRAVSADPEAVFTLWLMPDRRDYGWGRQVELAGGVGRWCLIEEDLRRMPEYWHNERGGLRGEEVPPIKPGEIALVELGVNLGDAEVLVDDLEFVHRESAPATR